MRPVTRLVLGCALGAAAACGDPSGPSALRSHLEEWRERGPAQYTFQFQRSCFCIPTATAAVFITVNAGQVVSVVREDGQPLSDADAQAFFRITIDSLFGIIGHALDQDAAHLQVTYDPRLGYPTHIAIDYDAHVVDEEMDYTALLPARL
jgi:hypothetical protein